MQAPLPTEAEYQPAASQGEVVAANGRTRLFVLQLTVASGMES